MGWHTYLARLSVLGLGLAAACIFTADSAYADNIGRKVVGKDRTHIVQSGETIYSIAKKYGLAIEHLCFANGRDPNNINVAPGTSLLIPGRKVLPANPPSDGIVVNLPERGCFLFRNGKFEKFYPIAIGQPGRFQTPTGNYAIESRTVDPIWMPPEWAGLEEKEVPAGPDNPLGDRWIGISAPGIGMHSTTSPMSIGQAVSHGCMRMYPESVHELFDKVRVGWPVRIEYETSKIGRESGTDLCYIVTFPDVYGTSGVRNAAAKSLENAGLSVSDEDLKFLASGDGVAKELYISSVSIAVGKDRISSWPIEPSMTDGTIWGSPKVAAAAGLDVAWDGQKQVVKISRGRLIQYYPVDESYIIDAGEVPEGYQAEIAGYARRIDGNTIIPVRPVIKGFKLDSQWDAENRTLIISSVPKPKAKPSVPGKAVPVKKSDSAAENTAKTAPENSVKSDDSQQKQTEKNYESSVPAPAEQNVKSTSESYESSVKNGGQEGKPVMNAVPTVIIDNSDLNNKGTSTYMPAGKKAEKNSSADLNTDSVVNRDIEIQK